jgi:hypothetical protein
MKIEEIAVETLRAMEEEKAKEVEVAAENRAAASARLERLEEELGALRALIRMRGGFEERSRIEALQLTKSRLNEEAERERG